MNDSDRVEWTADAKRAFLVQSYAPSPVIDGVRLADLRRHQDDGGSMTELGRFTLGRHEVFEGFEIRQINYSEMQPGAIKAFHLHTRQTDIWYTPPSDRLLIVLFDARHNSPTEGMQMRFMLGNGASRLLRIPPGVAHGARNLDLRPGRIIYFVDVQFSPKPAECDEGRLPWDFLGPEVWEMVRG